jgi:hypothetical protein
VSKGIAILEKNLAVSLKRKYTNLMDPAITLLEIHLGEMKS